jgi:hypothetical protein
MISNSSTKSWRCIGRILARPRAGLLVVGQDHLAHRHDAIAFEEHVLGAAEPDALGAELARGARRRSASRHWCGPAELAELVGPFHELREVAAELGLDGRHDAEHDLAGAAVERDVSPAFSTVPRTLSVPALPSMRTSPAPATQGLPMPRATTAAWLVMPPRRGQDARAACMPWMSSGLVSRRTRITFSPARACFSAASAVNTILPEAAPGEAGRPGARPCAGLGIERRVQELVERGRDRCADGLRLSISPRAPCRRRS